MQKRMIRAFTLAEVLITLLIIGVVASLTIPGLISDTQNQEYRVAWKKEFAVLSQVYKQVLVENGGSFKNICTGWNHNCLRNLFLEKLSASKICSAGATYSTCWHSVNNHYPVNDSFKLLNGNGNFQVNSIGGYFNDASSGLILNDGTLLLFFYGDANCQSQGFSHLWYDDFPNGCGFITIDINGFKGPNTVGKDIYGVYVLDNSMKPVGSGWMKSTCSSTDTGQGCAALYLTQ